MLSELRCVDAVVPFEETTPARLIEVLRPEMHVKGGDYTIESISEAKIVTSYGGEVVIVPLLKGRLTTAILKRIGLE